MQASKHNQWLREYRTAHPEKARAYYQAHREKAASDALYRRYGISGRAYTVLLVAQHGTCAICHQVETARDRSGNVKPLAVDHDHTTGNVRGLLCHNCNLLIGQIEAIQGEPSQILADALAYLDAPRPQAETRTPSMFTE